MMLNCYYYHCSYWYLFDYCRFSVGNVSFFQNERMTTHSRQPAIPPQTNESPASFSKKNQKKQSITIQCNQLNSKKRSKFCSRSGNRSRSSCTSLIFVFASFTSIGNLSAIYRLQETSSVDYLPTKVGKESELLTSNRLVE